MTDGNSLQSLRFEVLSKPHGGDFDALLKLYEEALPARERKSGNALHSMMLNPDYKIMIARESHEVVGFAVVLIGRTMALLEYMAVQARWRGAGVGSNLYQWIRDRELSPTLPLLVEIDSDRELSVDQAIRAQRKRFYQRLGCRQIIGLKYILPLPGEGAPPLMDLLVDGDWLGDAVSQAVVAAWLGEIYSAAYGCSLGDSRLIAMVTSLPIEVALR